MGHEDPDHGPASSGVEQTVKDASGELGASRIEDEPN